ncbi:MAG: two-component sensor histidine kinase, partial [Pseudomonadota bacterium]
MINRLPALVRTTTFRLALVHAALFIVFSGALLVYLYSATAGYLGRQAGSELNAEVSALSAAYARGGFSRLNQSVIERSSARGPFFYLLVRGDGSKVSGDFDMLPDDPPEVGQTDISFDYEARSIEGDVQRKSAA